jgi:hypothetical protein
MSQETPKLIKCYEYGTLRQAIMAEEETWVFETHNFEYVFMNSTFIQALDDMSMEGWDLVCKGDLEFILRTPVEKLEPQPCVDDEDEETEEEVILK